MDAMRCETQLIWRAMAGDLRPEKRENSGTRDVKNREDSVSGVETTKSI